MIRTVIMIFTTMLVENLFTHRIYPIISLVLADLILGHENTSRREKKNCRARRRLPKCTQARYILYHVLSLKLAIAADTIDS